MIIQEIENKSQWNNLVTQAGGSFLQSWEWGDFQKAVGHEVRRIAVSSEGPVMIAQVFTHRLPLNNFYYYMPRGPVVLNKGMADEALRIVVNHLKDGMFLRLEPDRTFDEEILLKTKFKKQGFEIQPKKTLILDLSPTLDELLSQMRRSTRYEISFAKKSGISVSSDAVSESLIKRFWDLISKTSSRQQFKSHSRDYYKKMIELLGKVGMLKIFSASHEGKILAMNLVIFWNDTATHLHGASDPDYKDLRSTNLLQWQAICEAKERGFRFFDFWGIDEKKWPGFTHFKKSFGGEEVSFPGVFDYVQKRGWYALFDVFSKFRRLKK